MRYVTESYNNRVHDFRMARWYMRDDMREGNDHPSAWGNIGKLRDYMEHKCPQVANDWDEP